MRLRTCLLVLGTFLILSCELGTREVSPDQTYPDVQVVGAMRDVMWKGRLEGRFQLDSIGNKEGFYGLGPLSYLRGELLINDGKSYISRVNDDSTMTVEKGDHSSAPFFVYAQVMEWEIEDLPTDIHSISELERYLDSKTKDRKRPFAFKLKGAINQATIHIQNLPLGTAVSSPDEAHQGQVKYALNNENVEIIGFFSTEHKGIFTHHDSNLHMHLITANEAKMGHLDQVELGEIKLYLPIR